jgi:hypothetical protein
LPELTTSTRALPRGNIARHQSTGAEGHFDRVRTPAAVVPGAISATMRSLTPFAFFRPTARPVRRTPATGAMAGKRAGANGERVGAGALAALTLEPDFFFDVPVLAIVQTPESK